jgi:hypothetical protein
MIIMLKNKKGVVMSEEFVLFKLSSLWYSLVTIW